MFRLGHFTSAIMRGVVGGTICRDAPCFKENTSAGATTGQLSFSNGVLNHGFMEFLGLLICLFFLFVLLFIFLEGMSSGICIPPERKGSIYLLEVLLVSNRLV